MPVLTRDIIVTFPDGEASEGTLSLPEIAKAIVIFAHGSGSNKDSPRNNYVSSFLNDYGIATLLVNLLTKEETVLDHNTNEFRFNIALLTKRLISVTRYVATLPETKSLSIGYFGASTGAAAALASAASNEIINLKAIVSRGGRPDLAGASLGKVRAATLLIVGGNDTPVIALNQKAFQQLKNVDALNKRLLIVPGAGHTFEEEGTIQEVARHACSWFERYSLQ